MQLYSTKYDYKGIIQVDTQNKIEILPSYHVLQCSQKILELLKQSDRCQETKHAQGAHQPTQIKGKILEEKRNKKRTSKRSGSKQVVKLLSQLCFLAHQHNKQTNIENCQSLGKVLNRPGAQCIGITFLRTGFRHAEWCGKG